MKKTECSNRNFLICYSRFVGFLAILFVRQGVVKLSRVFIFFIVSFLLLSNRAEAQKEVDLSVYSPAYFDSIRAMVYDTTNQNYLISAYRLKENEKIEIDGKLSESAWILAEHRGDFIEKEPYPLIPMREKSEFAILYDEENLYLGVWCWDSKPEDIVQILSPRGTSAPDHLMFFIDSYFDKRTGYKFMVTPTGVQGDELRYDDVKRDQNWNGIWYSESSVDEKGWYAEVKIPFYNLRFSRKEEQTWGFNIMRTISRLATRGQWKPHLPEWDNTTRMSQLGEIRGMKNISSGRMFEIRPYGTLSSSEALETSQSNAFNFGGDVRFCPTPNITADFTFNPDFAQVDADVFEINLTRFPTRFKELRPFFTERINVFNTPLELFYSRRIGAAGDILGGAKATGKLNHGVEFGVIGNLTGESLFSGTTAHEKATYGIMRVKKDILGSSSIGFMGATKEEKEAYNRIFGVDGSFVLSDHDIVDIQVATGQTELEYKKNMAYVLSYMRTGDSFGIIYNMERVEPFFEINRVGYIQKEESRGWNKTDGIFRLSPRINKHNIHKIIANAEIGYNQDVYTDVYINDWLAKNTEMIPDERFGDVNTVNEDRVITNGERYINNFLLGGDLSVTSANDAAVLVGYKRVNASELTGSYSGNIYSFNLTTRPVKSGAKIAAVVDASSGVMYNFSQKYVGKQKSVSIDGEGRIGRGFLTKLQGEYTQTLNPLGEKDGRYYTLSSNSTYMFSKYFYFRLHAQGIFGTTWYTDKEVYNEYLLSGLLSWEYRPGSFLYLAYNEGRFDATGPQGSNKMKLNNRTLILKLSYFFSL